MKITIHEFLLKNNETYERDLNLQMDQDTSNQT